MQEKHMNLFTGQPIGHSLTHTCSACTSKAGPSSYANGWTTGSSKTCLMYRWFWVIRVNEFYFMMENGTRIQPYHARTFYMYTNLLLVSVQSIVDLLGSTLNDDHHYFWVIYELEMDDDCVDCLYADNYWQFAYQKLCFNYVFYFTCLCLFLGIEAKTCKRAVSSVVATCVQPSKTYTISCLVKHWSIIFRHYQRARYYCTAYSWAANKWNWKNLSQERVINDETEIDLFWFIVVQLIANLFVSPSA